MIALDASVLFGAVERHNVRQVASKRVVQGLPGPFVTTETRMAEAMHLAGSRGGWRSQERIWILAASISLSVATTEFPDIERLMRRYRDVPMDGATLVALCSEEPRARVGASTRTSSPTAATTAPPSPSSTTASWPGTEGHQGVGVE